MGRLAAISVMQLLIVVPISLAGVLAFVYFGVTDAGALFTTGTLVYWPLTLFWFGATFGVVCLWVSIVSKPETIAAHRGIYICVVIGLIVGCIIASGIIWFSLHSTKGIEWDDAFYGIPLVLGLIHLVRIVRQLLASPPIADDHA